MLLGTLLTTFVAREEHQLCPAPGLHQRNAHHLVHFVVFDLAVGAVGGLGLDAQACTSHTHVRNILNSGQTRHSTPKAKGRADPTRSHADGHSPSGSSDTWMAEERHLTSRLLTACAGRRVGNGAEAAMGRCSAAARRSLGNARL